MRPLYRTLLITGLLLVLTGFFISIGAFFGGASIHSIQQSFQNTYQSSRYKDTGSDSEGGWSGSQEDSMNDVVAFDNNKEIHSIDISLSMAQVILEKGSSFEIRTSDIPEDEVRTSFSSDGKLRISNNDSNKIGSIFGQRWVNRDPKIIITLPGDLSLDYLSIEIGAGSFISDQIDIQTDKARLKVGAGEIKFLNIHTEKLTADCGMGSLVMSGRIRGPSIFDCGMGSMNVSIEGDRSDYSYSAHVGLGNVRVNDEEISGFGNSTGSKKLSNHLDIECGMGDVKITIK